MPARQKQQQRFCLSRARVENSGTSFAPPVLWAVRYLVAASRLLVLVFIAAASSFLLQLRRSCCCRVTTPRRRWPCEVKLNRNCLSCRPRFLAGRATAAL
mmetsp:Transcript_65222/g.112141  ORF Transcript_65222/g.112141 Transcript_65222/m.112141 type:complete len:100 (+) Transcript_65222:134-433(+)